MFLWGVSESKYLDGTGDAVTKRFSKLNAASSIFEMFSVVSRTGVKQHVRCTENRLEFKIS